MTKALLLQVVLLATFVCSYSGCDHPMDQQLVANRNQLLEYLKVAERLHERDGNVSRVALVQEFRRLDVPLIDYWGKPVVVEVADRCVSFVATTPGGSQLEKKCFDGQSER